MNSAPNLTGMIFGRWTVLNQENSVKRRSRWSCRCLCGTEKIVMGQSLVRGLSKSCGCYNSEKHRKDGQEQAWNMYYSRVIMQSAISRSIDFNLSLSFVKTECSKNCSYCGCSPREWRSSYNQYLSSALLKNTLKPDIDFANSKIIFVNGLDRVNPNGSYTEDNVVPCCPTCNYAKLSMFVREFEDWILRVYKHRNLVEEFKK